MATTSSSIDWPKARLAANQFALATGIACHVIDESGSAVTEDPHSQGPPSCALCRAYRELAGQTIECHKVHLYGATQSFRFGGRYTYDCPLSLVHFTSPLMEDGQMRGALVGGPVLLIDPEEYIQEELTRRIELDPVKRRRFQEALSEIPQVSTERARALTDQLMFAASWASSIPRYLEITESHTKQMAIISERIQRLKEEEEGRGPSPYPLGLERSLIRSITHGDKEESSALLNELLGTLYFTTGANLDTMKARIRELIVLLSRAALDGGADPESVFGLNLKSHSDIDDFRSVDQLSHWLGGMLQKYVSYVFDVQAVRHRDVILKAMAYIRRRFAGKVTLEDVAAEVSLSPTYFSRLFKEEAGQSFKSFLNSLRIEEAKHLLAETDLQLIEVASRVGFEDQSYFSRVFRNVVGISPGRFRRSADGSLPGSSEEIHS